MDPSKERVAADQGSPLSEKDNTSATLDHPTLDPNQFAAPPKPAEMEADLNPELDNPSDFLGDAEKTEPGKPSAQPLSQAALDLARGLAPEGGPPTEKHKKPELSNQKPIPTRPPAFRWFLLLILSLAGLFVWALEAQLSQRPFLWLAWGFLVAGLAIGVLPFRFFPRLPTRAGLTAFIWALSFYVSALYGPPAIIFKWVPAALCWAGLLTLIIFWLLIRVWHKLKKVKPAAIILTLIIAYAALGPVWALASRLAQGYLLSLDFASLALSPSFITGSLGWFCWPLTAAVALLLPLSAIFALWDQMSTLRRPGRRHGGDFFLALAFVALIPYGFLSFGQAAAAHQSWSDGLRAIYPPALEHLQASNTTTPAELLSQPENSMPSTVVEPAEQFTTTSEADAAAPAEQPVPAAPLVSGPVAFDLEQRLAAVESQLSQTNEKLDQLEKRLHDLLSLLNQPPSPAQEEPAPEAGPPPLFSEPFDPPAPGPLKPEPPMVPDYQSKSTSQKAPASHLRMESVFLGC